MKNEDLLLHLSKCVDLLKTFDGLLDAYVTDFFVGADKEVNNSWLSSLSRLSPPELAQFMPGNDVEKLKVVSNSVNLPLSFLAFKSLCHSLTLNEGQLGEALFSEARTDLLQLIENELRQCSHTVPSSLNKHMKPKKQHEIVRLAKLISLLGSVLAVDTVLDVGAGHGHLARLLSFSHKMKVVTIEAETRCAPIAAKMDEEARYKLRKIQNLQAPLPVHLTCTIRKEDEVLPLVNGRDANLMRTGNENGFDGSSRNKENDEGKYNGNPVLNLADTGDVRREKSKTFSLDQQISTGGVILTGLHACGDLTTTVIKNFARDTSHGKGMVSIGCCYMRCEPPWRPLSDAACRLNVKLSFEALELACHHLSSYRERLTLCHEPSMTLEEMWSRLRCQSYRAGFTLLLTRLGHPLRHGTGVRCKMKISNDMTFKQYCESLLARLHLSDVPVPDALMSEIETLVHHQNSSVIAFYTVRLMLAPVVETVILLDRLLYLRERGYQESYLVRLFDSSISPRNLALVAWR